MFRAVWYTDAEYDLVREAAKLCGKPTSVFVRAESLGRRYKTRAFLANAELVRELSKSGVALTRLAATARETGALPVADVLETALQELRALLRQIVSAGSARAQTSVQPRP